MGQKAEELDQQARAATPRLALEIVRIVIAASYRFASSQNC